MTEEQRTTEEAMEGTKDGDVFAGTYLEQVAEIIASGEYELSDSPVKEGEEVVGELLPAEKAIFTMFERASQKHEEAVNEVKASQGKGADLTPQIREIKHLEQQISALNRLFWVMVEDRLGLYGKRCVIRENDQVAVYKEISEEIKQMLGAVLGGVPGKVVSETIIIGGGHGMGFMGFPGLSEDDEDDEPGNSSEPTFRGAAAATAKRLANWLQPKPKQRGGC